MKISLEKQRTWDRKKLEEFLHLGVEGFTITDLPFSTILQAYWFLAAFGANLFLEKFSFWRDTDSYYFYKNIMGTKSKWEFLRIFCRLHSRLLDKHNMFSKLSYTPKAIATVAGNGHTKHHLRNRIDRLAKEQILGLFIVSGGGILQLLLKHNFPFKYFLNSSINLISYVKNKYPNIKIYAAANTNLKSENTEKILQKKPAVLLTQPPFLWQQFENYLENISINADTNKIEIRVGVPIFTNPWNVRFWMQLVGIDWRKEKETKELVRLFENKYNNDKSEKKIEFKEFSKNWTISFIHKIQKLQEKYSQVQGIHLMPMGNYIPVEDIIKSFNIAKNSHSRSSLPTFLDPTLKKAGPTPNSIENFPLISSPSPIKYEIIKYKNHFRNLETEENQNKVYLDAEFVPQSKSKIWDLNQMFWENVDDFMLAIGRNYHKSVGGSADSNLNLAKYSAQKFYEQHKNISKEINYLEMGAAGIEWSKMFLDEINNLGGLPNFNYIFTDYSRKPLLLARQVLGDKYGTTSIKYIYLGDGKVKNFFEIYKGNISQIHATNIYDNFPMDRILYQNGKIYAVLVRAFINNSNKDVFPEFFKTYSERNLKPEFYINWQKLWNELKFEEKYVEIHPEINKVEFNFYNKLNPKNIELEMNVSSEITKNILRNFELLALGGVLEIIDIVAGSAEKYKEFLGPVKYDGSIANYVNLPEITHFLNEKNINFVYDIQSLEKFGGRKNQSILEIVKN